MLSLGRTMESGGEGGERSGVSGWRWGVTKKKLEFRGYINSSSITKRLGSVFCYIILDIRFLRH